MSKVSDAKAQGAERTAEGKAPNTTWELGTQSREVLAARVEGSNEVRVGAAIAKAGR
jgi:hypothetical protein